MPRRPRQELAGGVFHVVARGNARDAIYRDDSDRLEYLRLLRRVARKTGWVVGAYCLMTNHVHLLITTPQPNLAWGMQWFHGHYGRYFNERHGRVGHVFQGRYKAIRQQTDDQMTRTLVYIRRNPVEAGLCAAPEDYAWMGVAGFESATSRVGSAGSFTDDSGGTPNYMLAVDVNGDRGRDVVPPSRRARVRGGTRRSSQNLG